MFIINFDELNFRELFEVFHKRARNSIERAIRLATAREIHMHDTIGKRNFAVAGETVEHEGESLVAFDITGTFEIFVKHCAN